jgi:integrase
MSKYQKLSKYKGIKKDLSNGRYLAVKYLNGKQYSKKFDTLRQAVNWRANFHPSVSECVIENKIKNSTLSDFVQTSSVKLNGEDLGYYFRDLWKLYSEIYLQSLERSSMEHRLAKANFYEPLMDYKMVEMTATLLDGFMAQHKVEAIRAKSKRFNFDDDLKALKALLNWYRENYDALFVNPVLPRHKQVGIIKKTVKKNKKLKPEELLAFFGELPSFWRDFAETQFYMGSRVSEVAGLQVGSVDLKEGEIIVQHVVVWSYKTKKFEYLKDCTKNGDISYASMNVRLKEIVKRRLECAVNGFLFHIDGEVPSYRQIQYQYNLALKKAGLADKYSSTHIMRHSMGTITRKVTGSADMAQAVTRHKDIKVAQQYASLPTEANKQAVNDVFSYLNNLEIDKPKTSLKIVESDKS